MTDLIQQPPEPSKPVRRLDMRSRRAILRLSLVLIAVTVVVATVWPVWGAVELAFYQATASDTTVFLEWSTVREFNLAGFEILCKPVAAPESTYHPIGSRTAQGGPDRGALYQFEVTSGLTPGEAYCFRLSEITTDGAPSEAFDQCGYGPGVTPTPTVEGAIVFEPTPTLIVITLTVTPEGQPLLSEFDLTSTAIAASPLDAQQSPLGAPVSPLGTPVAEAPGVVAAGAETPTETPTATLIETPVETATETPTPTETATLTPTETLTNAQGLGPAVDAVVMAESTPTPLYLVVTATPTPEALAAVAIFTPLPTVTPVADTSLASFFVPSTQNIMVMLLCMTFLSATGLGILGLLTSVVYMRSRQRGEERDLTRYRKDVRR